MARPHIEFVQALDVPEEPIGDGRFAGASQRLLSEDDETGAYTALVSLPAGWSSDLSAYERPVELFVIDGELDLDGRRMGPGCYACVPCWAEGPKVAASTSAHALVMVEPESSDGGGSVEVIDTGTMRWQAPDLDADVPPGIVIKLLRVDPAIGDWTWVAAVVPGWQEDRAEIHPTVEECFMIRGDVLLGHRGAMEAGSYFWRPGMVRHGPMFTRNGGLFFFRTKGGGMAVTHEPVPGWKTMVDDYVSKEPYFPRKLD